jgi:hypothetical protein
MQLEMVVPLTAGDSDSSEGLVIYSHNRYSLNCMCGSACRFSVSLSFTGRHWS